MIGDLVPEMTQNHTGHLAFFYDLDNALNFSSHSLGMQTSYKNTLK